MVTSRGDAASAACEGTAGESVIAVGNAGLADGSGDDPVASLEVERVVIVVADGAERVAWRISYQKFLCPPAWAVKVVRLPLASLT